VSFEGDQLAIYEYNQKFPDTISVYMIDFSDESQVKLLAVPMRKAIKDDAPLDDSIFDLPESALS